MKYLSIHDLMTSDFLYEFYPHEQVISPVNKVLKYKGTKSLVKDENFIYYRYLYFMSNPLNDGIVIRCCQN